MWSAVPALAGAAESPPTASARIDAQRRPVVSHIAITEAGSARQPAHPFWEAAGARSLSLVAVTPACRAATAKVNQLKDEIEKASRNLKNVNVTNVAGVVNETRKRQLERRLAQLRAALAKALETKKAACPPTLSAYDGTYSGRFPGTALDFSFKVANGVITGDVTGRIADAKSGNAVGAKASFAGAECGAATLHFDGTAGTATSLGPVTCTMAGLKATGTLTARRR